MNTLPILESPISHWRTWFPMIRVLAGKQLAGWVLGGSGKAGEDEDKTKGRSTSRISEHEVFSSCTYVSKYASIRSIMLIRGDRSYAPIETLRLHKHYYVIVLPTPHIIGANT